MYSKTLVLKDDEITKFLQNRNQLISLFYYLSYFQQKNSHYVRVRFSFTKMY